jgi:hypothetical protein
MSPRATALLLPFALLACKPKVAGPEEPKSVEVEAYSHCADAIELRVDVAAGDASRTVTLEPDTPAKVRLDPGDTVVLEGAAPASVTKPGATIVVGSTCRTLIASDLGGFDDPDA